MHTINLTFKCLKGSPPMFFKDYFKVFRTIHNTRGSGHNLLLPKVRTETARKSFYFNGSKLFNNLASEMKDSKSVVIFKTRILELYRSKLFSYLLSFWISLASKCMLIAVILAFFKQFCHSCCIFNFLYILVTVISRALNDIAAFHAEETTLAK